MTARLENNQIIFGKDWGKNKGWVGLAEIQQGQWPKAINYKFIDTKPLTEEDQANNHRRKHCEHFAVIPTDYSGLIVSESAIYAERKSERWFWWAKDGILIANAESLPDLIEKIK
jgi:hypothetical protein